jgi:hypothetical protein
VEVRARVHATAPQQGAVLPAGGETEISGRAHQKQTAELRGSVLILRLEEPAALAALRDDGPAPASDDRRSDLHEARARLMLLQPLSAARNQRGDVFLARVLEPVRLGEQIVVPEGGLIQGRIAQRKAPRCLRRAGLLRLDFRRLSLPESDPMEVSASLVAIDAGSGPQLVLDSEGTVRAKAPSKKRAAIDLGLAYVVGKVTDDLLEEGVKLGVSAAATGTVTTVARYVGIAAGVLFFFAQRGRDVVLPEYSELEVTFAHPEVIAGKRPRHASSSPE